jgi:hypothetical protein
MIETINKLIRTSRYLVQELGREPNPEEIAERMDIPLEKVRKVLKIAKEPISLETPIGEEEDSHLGDFIEDKNTTSPVDSVINIDLAGSGQGNGSLTPREACSPDAVRDRREIDHTRGGGSGLRGDPRSRSARSRRRLRKCATQAGASGCGPSWSEAGADGVDTLRAGGR